MIYTLIITNTATHETETKTTRSKREAYTIYDKAVNDGLLVEAFTDSRGWDWSDRQECQIAIRSAA